MRCPGFSAEQYDLYAIGTLEGSEASEVAAHVAGNCETCSRELKKSLQFWTLFGTTFSPDAGLPRRRLVMSPAHPAVAGPSEKTGRLSWYQWGAIAASLAVISAAATWYIAVRSTPVQRSSTVRLVADNERLQQRITDLSRERDELVQQRDSARTQAAAAKSSSNATLLRSLGQRQAQLNGVEQTLAAMQGRFAQSESALQDARIREATLETQLNSQQTRLQAALRDQQAAQSHLADVNAQVQRAEAQVQTLTIQVRELTKERSDLIQAMQVQQRQSSQSLRMISMLSSPGTRLIQVPGTAAAPEAHAYALLTADRRLVFFETGLPALPSGRDYQLWLIRSKSPAIVSAGVFHSGVNEAGQVEYANTQLASNITAIAVTDEPAGGSSKPTGRKVLAGLVKPS